jgi:RND superfamily putative drug exporter
MTLLGDKAWWMPRWLDRIVPNVSLEGGHDSRAKAVEERELANV